MTPTVALFEADGYSAWDHHFVKHVFNKGNGAECEGWRLLSPQLRAFLGNGTTLDDLRRDACQRCDPPEGHALWALFREYLRLVRDAIEKGVGLFWFWEQSDGGEGTWNAFSPCAVFGVFNDQKLKTGYLPSGPPDPPGAEERVRQYRLFLACLRKVRDKYQTAGRRQKVTGPAREPFRKIMASEPTVGEWEKF